MYQLARRRLCSICAKPAMHLHPPLLPERLNRANSVMHISLPRSWECITHAATCNMKRFTFSGLMHPNGDARTSSVPLRPCMDAPPPPSPDRVNRLHSGAALPQVGYIRQAVIQVLGPNVPIRRCLGTS